MYTITTLSNAEFAFSVPRPRLGASGFKQVKPRLLRQANTAKLKRPGLPRSLVKKPFMPRPAPIAPKPY